jgi:glycogen synthase
MTADTVGGVWTYALGLCGALGRHGVQVALATMGPRMSADQRDGIGQLANVQVHESDYRLEWMDEPWADVERSGEWLLGLERDFEPDVVHLNGYAHGCLAWRAPCVAVGHSCVLSWWHAVKYEEAPRSWDRYRSTVARGLRAADFVVAPSLAMLAELQRYYGPFRASAVARNGRDPEGYHAAPKEPFVFAAGRVWDEAKNIAMLGRVRTDWPVYAAGEARHPNGELRAPRNVISLGPLAASELAGWYARAAIFCSPALYEPFGLSILEAALSGCALVLSDLASLRENWEGAATFVPPGDAPALEDVLARLSGDAAMRQSLAERARERARRFTPERMAGAYLAVYESLG